MSRPLEEHSARATFNLTRENLEKIKKRVLSMWDIVEGGAESMGITKPTTLSTFILTCAYVVVCIAKAIQETERDKKKFIFGFNVDVRARLEPPIPENYFGNCVISHLVDTEIEDFTKEDGFVIVAKKIYGKIKMLEKGGGVDELEKLYSRLFKSMMMAMGGRLQAIGVTGSNKFGVYGIDFGWGKPDKVELTSVDRDVTIGLAESKNGNGGVEVGLVLNKHVMDLFHGFFHEELAML